MLDELAPIAGWRHCWELLKAGVDIRKALGRSSLTITEEYYAKWNKAHQDIFDGDLARAWKRCGRDRERERHGNGTGHLPRFNAAWQVGS